MFRSSDSANLAIPSDLPRVSVFYLHSSDSAGSALLLLDGLSNENAQQFPGHVEDSDSVLSASTSDTITTHLSIQEKAPVELRGEHRFKEIPLAKGRQVEVTASTTETESYSSTSQAERVLSRLWFTARDVYFEDGYENDFSIALCTLLEDEPQLYLEAIKNMGDDASNSPDITYEAVKLVGRILPADAPVRSFISFFLRHENPSLREAAARSAEELNTKRIVPILRKRLSEETNTSVRTELTEIIAQLDV